MRTEEDLLSRAQSGELAALDEILARHQARIFRYGVRMCGDVEDARDVLQDTLFAAYRNVRSFRGGSHLSTWLIQIARNFCLRSRRRAVGQPRWLAPLETASSVPAEEPRPDAEAHAHELSEILQAAIDALPPLHREALILREVHGLSADAAARAAGIAVGALKSRLHRARVALRERLTEIRGRAGILGEG